MKNKLLTLIALLAATTLAICESKITKNNPGNWAKYKNNPNLGGNLGTVYDPCIVKTDSGGYRMYFSWYDNSLGIGLATSTDGLTWEKPTICFEFDFIKNMKHWDQFANRPVVLMKDGIYHMWYSGQNATQSAIGYATSHDGIAWTKKSELPVLKPNAPWENNFIFCSQVIWDKKENLFKMWYSGGDRVEPTAIGYATSTDGYGWTKHTGNPVFASGGPGSWEQHGVNHGQVIRRDNDYLMFYAGYADAEHPQIGMARSKDGIANWERYSGNPIVKPGDGWDCNALYTPYAIEDTANNRWLLFYNGRRQWIEQLGVAIYNGKELEF